MELEIQEIINKNLPAQVGDVLKKRLQKADDDAALLLKQKEESDRKSKIISDLEERLGKNNEQVLFQKKFYTLVLLEHLDFVNQINLKCNYSIPTILFFYSNKDETIDKNENVGNLLDHLSNKYSELKVYPFDVNLNDALIESLILRYNVNEVPTVVLGNGTSIVNPTNVDQIETYLR